MKKKINVLISCVGGLFIYDVIESLRKSKDFNIKIYGIDIDTFAYNKSLLDFFFKCPDVLKSEKKYLELYLYPENHHLSRLGNLKISEILSDRIKLFNNEEFYIIFF